ncbi:putative protein kinase [Powai lake megavirus]|uniref:ABC1 atypical kinase-like domain-containing protein n=1 Tax=Powai lake megavirus TaxID=1842663 RepID=A0A167R6U4_9VIRU|nr:putative protein kinase [Powai lake megavirus]ANB50373.1 putative protein kinase [Powai lake megavirus]
MPVPCVDLINKLNKSIEMANDEIIHNMTQSSTKYDWVCIKNNITYNYYFDFLKKNWDKIIIKHISQSNNPWKIIDFINIHKKINIKDNDLQDILNTIISNEMSNTSYPITDFELSVDMFENISQICHILFHSFQIIEIYKCFVRKYKTKYSTKYDKSEPEISNIIKKDFDHIINKIQNIISDKSIKNQFFNNLSANLYDIYSLTIKNELSNNLPDDLGLLKNLFTKIISTYYDNLHPIIWTQIFSGIAENIFIDLPNNDQDILKLLSGQILINSGPFILKIIQFIKPIMTRNQIKKYSLDNIKYPKLTNSQINIILDKIINNYEMYNIISNHSASVAHVCQMYHLSDPKNIFVVKIIKPLSIVQSCWEYKILNNIFDKSCCEYDFIKKMLESTGREFNVQNEINNMVKAFKYYTCTYSSIFGHNIEAKLTTTKYLPNIVNDKSWFAFAMTKAEGITLDKIIDDKIKIKNTTYYYNLHRCLDLLVYKFFYQIIKNGFYHGDLHAGNIFYSHKLSQITLIDFGCVNKIDLFSNNDISQIIIDILIKSIFFNYSGILDTITCYINNKCEERKIDTNSSYYIQFIKELDDIRSINIKNKKHMDEQYKEYNDRLFDINFINQEKNKKQDDVKIGQNENNTIYKYLDLELPLEEPEYTQLMPINYSSNIFGNIIGLSDILEKITKFYLSNGINIAIRFNQFYEFQRAYLLLVNVLKSVDYDDYRMSNIINKAIINWKNLPELFHLKTTIHATKIYFRERKIYNDIIYSNNNNYNDTFLKKHISDNDLYISD